jgi:hypothetical protein
VAEFGAVFVTEMRRRTALAPRPLRELDTVDVFSGAGQFLFRGVVQERDKAWALVAVNSEGAENNRAAAGMTTQRVRIENCRHADALPPPASLSDWEAARGVASSKPPL